MARAAVERAVEQALDERRQALDALENIAMWDRLPVREGPRRYAAATLDRIKRGQRRRR